MNSSNTGLLLVILTAYPREQSECLEAGDLGLSGLK